MAWTSWSGSNIVDVGVQTDGMQDQFAIVQLFISSNGENAFVQVANTSNSNTNWMSYVVTVGDSADATAAAGPKAVTDSSTKAK